MIGKCQAVNGKLGNSTTRETMKIKDKIEMDLIVKSREDYKKAVLSFIEEDKEALILDLGCGDYQRLTKKIREKIGTRHVPHGIDINIGGASKDMMTSRGDLNEPFPIGDLRFDVIIASQIIEHLWNIDGFLREIKKYLKPTGYAVISTPNLASLHNRIFLALGKQPPVLQDGDMYPEKEKPGHLRALTANELLKLLRFHGFKIESIKKTFGNITVKARR